MKNYPTSARFLDSGIIYNIIRYFAILFYETIKYFAILFQTTIKYFAMLFYNGIRYFAIRVIRSLPQIWSELPGVRLVQEPISNYNKEYLALLSTLDITIKCSNRVSNFNSLSRDVITLSCYVI